MLQRNKDLLLFTTGVPAIILGVPAIALGVNPTITVGVSPSFYPLRNTEEFVSRVITSKTFTPRLAEKRSALLWLTKAFPSQITATKRGLVDIVGSL